jgi:uncharacterized protein (TIGR03000 family)
VALVLQNVRRFGVLLVLAVAAFLGTPTLSLAQRGVGHSGGGGFAGGHGGFGGGGYARHGYGGRGFWGYISAFSGGFYDGYYPYSYGGYYPDYGLDYSPYYGPYPYGASGNPSSSLHIGNSGTTVFPGIGNGGSYNVVTVQVPVTVTVTVQRDAKVWFEDSPTTTTGTAREFLTSPLQPGGRYTYRVRATWEQNGQTVSQTQTVSVIPGQNLRIAFPMQSTTQGH